MKKILLILTIIPAIFIGALNVEAKGFTLSSYYKLGLNHTYVIGKYVFDLDSGYSPTLRDIMIASRSIPEGEPTTLYDIYTFPEDDYFEMTEVYSKKFTMEQNDFKPFDLKYLYRGTITGATSDKYEEL